MSPRPARKPTPLFTHMVGVIAANARWHRAKVGLTQEKLARRLGLSSNFIAFVEHGKRLVSLRTLVEMAGALGIQPAELLKPRGAHLPIQAPDIMRVKKLKRVAFLDEDGKCMYLASVGQPRVRRVRR